jgi:hypothetical protein
MIYIKLNYSKLKAKAFTNAGLISTSSKPSNSLIEVKPFSSYICISSLNLMNDALFKKSFILFYSFKLSPDKK